MFLVVLLVFALLVSCPSFATAAVRQYDISDRRGPARPLDGIGGLSGGGATSVFLWAYPEPQRSEILDFLFKPNFGASLQILKVEIGGDAQSTDGAESSHMHNPWDENYHRGYEWWLMKEAKKRNENIKLYGLAWAYPQWVTCAKDTMVNCTNDIYTHPDVTAEYIVKWISGAKNTHGLDIDYVGCWNERPWNDTYLKTLRAVLDAEGFATTKIVAPDGSWGLAEDILADSELAKAVYAIGAHYPGTNSTNDAEKTEKPLWASEDDSTYNNDVGAGCWARIINQNYVNGNMTASINWNLIAAYMKGTNWYRAGLMSAMQPWNGAYGSWGKDSVWTVGPMIWASAHTTQFTDPETWSYLHVGEGAGHLQKGGSYVTLKNFDTKSFTIVIEKMSRRHSSCVRPYLPNYVTENEQAVFQLAPSMLESLPQPKILYLWSTHWAYYPGDETKEFQGPEKIDINHNGQFTLNITVDSLYTLTTLNRGYKGTPPVLPPQPTLFPTVHIDNFNNCPISSEGRYFADQNGIWECVPSQDSRHGTVMQQMVPLKPVTWGGDIRPHTLIGHRDSKNTSLITAAYITEPGGSVLLGVRCRTTDNTLGVLFGVNSTTGQWGLWSSIGAAGNVDLAITSGASPVSIQPGEWNIYRMDANGSTLNVWINDQCVLKNYQLNANWLPFHSGHALLGTLAYGQYTQFDDFQLYSSYSHCPASKNTQQPQPGMRISVVECSSEVGVKTTSQWDFSAVPSSPKGSSSIISLRADPSLCIQASPSNSHDVVERQSVKAAEKSGKIQKRSAGNKNDNEQKPWWLQLAPCNASDPFQQWSWTFNGIAPDGEQVSYIYLAKYFFCLDIYQQDAEIGRDMDAWPCNMGLNQAFFYDFDAGEIANEATATCLGLC